MKNKCIKDIFPDESWEKDDNNGKSFIIFDRLLPFIVNKMNTTGLMVIRHGKLIFEYGDTEEISYIASCRKSVLAMLFGKYVENGVINLNLTLKELEIDDIQGLLDIEKKATIKDLITAKSGIYHPASNGGDHTADAPERGSKEPGEYFLYNNWDFNVLGAIFEKLTGITVFNALENDLAVPIGMQDFVHNEQKMLGDKSKSKHLAYHMWFSTRDMARLGYLLLRDGNWNGEQIISKKWIKEMLQVSTPREKMNPEIVKNGSYSYGYMWWLIDNPKLHKAYEGAYTARGYFGQYITVIPKLDLVIAHKTKGSYLRDTINYHILRDAIVENLHIVDNFDFEELELMDLEVRDAYLGVYDNNNGKVLKITKENNSIFGNINNEGQFKLVLKSKSIYSKKDDKKALFSYDFEDKKVSKITFTKGIYLDEYIKIE
jgi:CubicO group peptidase (beta-lactamase class C family)